jgi:hypothetical protein
MKQISFVRGALLGTAALLATSLSATAQTYPPGTNCLSLLGNLRTACMSQARQLNSVNGMSGSTTIPNSAGSNTVPTPGTNMNGINSGTTVRPNTTTNPNAVTPNGTISPNAVTPNGTVNPNAVGTPNSAPTGNPVIIPPAGTGTTGTTGTGTMGTGTGTGTTGAGAGSGTSGN